MFDTLTPDERRALNRKVVDWGARFGDVGHVLARTALAAGELDGAAWERRRRYCDTMAELIEIHEELHAGLIV